jgi:response regulator RpfG family c-di-GMP phosphodiesterase
LVILDWMMPGMDGPEVCRQFRATAEGQAAYIILLTARGDTSDLVTGLDSGADDYITKPFHSDELRARVRVGMRIASLQQSLAERVTDLEEALSQVTQLQGLLPICCYCKRIRDDGNYWHQVESYFAKRSSAQFSHGICPTCFEDVMKHTRETAAS